MDLNAVLIYRHGGRNMRESVALGEQEKGGFFTLEFAEEPGGGENFGAHLSFAGEEIEVLDFYVQLPCEYPRGVKILINGWQSWSESREYGPGEKRRKMNSLADFLLGTYGDYRFTPYGEGLTGWSYSYLRDGLDYLLLGALGEEDGFVKLTHFPGKCYVKIAKDAAGLTRSRGSLSLRFGIYRGREDEVFNRYFSGLGYPPRESPRTLGWTSWYNYYTRISEDIILKNLESFKEREIPIEIFQIDDGYQAQVGDWTRIKEEFPRGMGFIAESIRKCGYRAGLWLAPFVCTGKSEVYRNHPGWVARDDRGRPVKAGFNPRWGGFFYALDFYNPGFREHLGEVFATVFADWKFDMAKLDFLYAATLLPRRDKTRGEMMHEAMDYLRGLAGSKLLLGCGVPLAAAYGRVDFCRIGSDVGLTWEDPLLKALNYRERVSTVNSLAGTVGRRHLNHRVFKNDPDVFILRENNQKMSLAERKALLYLNMLLGGLIFTSDHIGEYGPEEMALYLEALKLKEARVLRVAAEKLVFVEVEQADGQKELFIFNLKDTEAGVELPAGLTAYAGAEGRRVPARDLLRIPAGGRVGIRRRHQISK